MTLSPLLSHGGAIDLARDIFGFPGPWIDLSTGIAPVPYPIPSVPREFYTRLPLQEWEAQFADAVVRAHRMPSGASVLPVAGEQAVLQCLPFCGPPKGRVVVPAPGYSGHADAWEKGGAVVEKHAQPLKAAGSAGVVVVINPNNPTGERFQPDLVLEAAARQAAIGGWLIVDEAFAEVAPDVSVLPWAGSPGLIVLRSFGKFFGLPGLRLGWVAAEAGFIQRVRDCLGPWAVSGPALWIGTQAEGNARWRARQRLRLQRRAARLDRVLAGAGLTVWGGTALFRTVRTPDATAWFEKLGRRGILVRAFAADPTLLRFGLPPTLADEHRLAEAIHS